LIDIRNQCTVAEILHIVWWRILFWATLYNSRTKLATTGVLLLHHEIKSTVSCSF